MLTAVLRRMSAKLSTLTDDEFVVIWLRFSRHVSLTPPAERPNRDVEFLNSLSAEWDKRLVRFDRDQAFFRWPSTLVADLAGKTSVEGEWPASGMLDAFGYHVGKTRGLAAETRQQILAFIFEARLPVVFDTSYTASWGEAQSAQRLHKLAETLAALTRNAKRNSAHDYSKAISDWEMDLQFLHGTYYVGHYRFFWPLARP